MSDFSTYSADQFRNHLFRTASFSKPSALYVSAHTGNPGATGASEVSNGSYARVQNDPGNANWTDETPAGQTKNAVDIVFPTSWAATVTYAGLWDASSGGNYLGRAQLTTPKSVTSADTLTFEAGALTFTFTPAT